MSEKTSIPDIVAEIKRNNSSVLFLDTCAILDIVRDLNRNKVETIQAARKIIELIDSGSINCKTVIFSLLEQEYNDNLDSVKRELETYFRNIADASKSFYDANKIFGNTYNYCNFGRDPLVKQITSLASQFIDKSASILAENDLHAAAHIRAINNIPPASKGKPEIKDCLLVEEYLEVCKQLKMKGIDVPLLLYSSNTSDFCDTEKKLLRQELILEFQANGLIFCYSWGNVLSELQKDRT